jgi:hypothetical protein
MNAEALHFDQVAAPNGRAIPRRDRQSAQRFIDRPYCEFEPVPHQSDASKPERGRMPVKFPSAAGLGGGFSQDHRRPR